MHQIVVRPNHFSLHTNNAIQLRWQCKVKSDLLDAINQKKVVCLVLLDLSMAFDTVNHEYLLNHLKYRFGVDGTVLTWLTDYLTD